MDNIYPNLIIAGVHKAGTTSLYKYLGDHPEVFASLKKELHYFTPLITGNNLPPIEQYLVHFKSSSDFKIRLEASPSYLYGQEKIISKIDEVIDNLKIIIMLRNPAERFISFYKQMISSMQIDSNEKLSEFYQKSVEAFVEFKKTNIVTGSPYNRSIREGMYVNYIKPWLKLGRNRLCVVLFDQLKENPGELLKSLSNWLGVEEAFYDQYNFKIENMSRKPKNRVLHSFVYNLYMKNEIFFRKNEFVKSTLKNIYDKINHRDFTDQTNDNVLSLLTDQYSSANKKLTEILLLNGYRDLPEWLSVS